MSTEITSSVSDKLLEIELKHDLDHLLYNYPLTLKTYVPINWQIAQIRQGDYAQDIRVESDVKGSYVIYSAIPNSGKIVIIDKEK